MINNSNIHISENSQIQSDGNITYYNSIVDTSVPLIVVEETEYNFGKAATQLLEEITNELCEMHKINKQMVFVISRSNGSDSFVRFNGTPESPLQFPLIDLKSPLAKGFIDSLLKQ